MSNNSTEVLTMARFNKSITLATFRLADDVLTYIDKNTYRMNREQARNSALDSVLTQCIDLINNYVREFYPQNTISVQFDDIVNTENTDNVPLDILILAYPATKNDINNKIKDELCYLIKRFVQSIRAISSDIFNSNIQDNYILTDEKEKFIDGYINNFISKNKGKTISKPFVCMIGGDDNLEIAIQGAFKSPVVQSVKTKKDEVFFAHSDGIKGSDMLVFLKRVGATNNQISGMTREFTAEKTSQAKIAAAAYASDFPLVKVVTYEKSDEKGKARNYIKDITQASLEDLNAFELKMVD